MLLLHELSRLIMVAKCGTTTHVGPSYWLTSNSAALAVAPKAHARARMGAEDFIVCFLPEKCGVALAFAPARRCSKHENHETKERVARRKVRGFL